MKKAGRLGQLCAKITDFRCSGGVFVTFIAKGEASCAAALTADAAIFAVGARKCTIGTSLEYLVEPLLTS